MTAVTIKNRDANPVILKSASGDSVQINPGATRIISDEFLIDYDTLKIRIISKDESVVTKVVANVPDIITNNNDETINFSANKAKATLSTKSK